MGVKKQRTERNQNDGPGSAAPEKTPAISGATVATYSSRIFFVRRPGARHCLICSKGEASRKGDY